jgi:hypothetical protein
MSEYLSFYLELVANMPQLTRTLSNALQNLKLTGRRESKADNVHFAEADSPELSSENEHISPANDPSETDSEVEFPSSKSPISPKFQSLVYHPGSEIPKPHLTFVFDLLFNITLPIEDALDSEHEDPRDEAIPKSSPRVLETIDQVLATTLSSSGFGSFLTGKEYATLVKTTDVDRQSNSFYQDWIIKSELVSTLDQLKSDTVVNYYVNIRTPILMFSPKSLLLLREVISRIKKDYETYIEEPLAENDGIHVFVGSGDQGFEDHVVKNIIATIYNFSPVLNTLHSPDRREHSLHHSTPLSRKPLTPLERIELLIDAQTSRNDAIDLVRLSLHYGFESLYTPYQPKMYPAIEFLQHEATIDEEKIDHWVKLCVGLVGYVKDADPVKLWDLLLMHCEGEGFELGSLFEELGMTEAKAFYLGERLYEAEGNENANSDVS